MVTVVLEKREEGDGGKELKIGDGKDRWSVVSKSLQLKHQ